jgi:hypothetical protein
MTKHDYTVLERSTIWPADRPLVKTKEGKLMSDMDIDEYLSTIERLTRDQLAREYVRRIVERGTSKKEIFAKFSDAPQAYIEDMVERLKYYLQKAGVQ